MLSGQGLDRERAVSFRLDDLVRVESTAATFRTIGVIGKVVKVNEATVHIVKADGYAGTWDNSRLTAFQKFKGFNVRKEYIVHHVK